VLESAGTLFSFHDDSSTELGWTTPKPDTGNGHGVKFQSLKTKAPALGRGGYQVLHDGS
jgi:hypothetical protein